MCVIKSNNPNNYVLFIGDSCKSLKAILLHKSNNVNPIPIAYGKNVAENYKTLILFFVLLTITILIGCLLQFSNAADFTRFEVSR